MEYFFLFFACLKQPRTVQVKQLSDLASEGEIREFFSFSGEIEHIEIRREPPPLLAQSRTAFVTFKDPKALEIALLLSVYLQLVLFFTFVMLYSSVSANVLFYECMLICSPAIIYNFRLFKACLESFENP